ncbi:MAG TPA: hypothetical protein PLC42_01170 [Parachlamydiaceae bacterium]|nr:hypothetical protein [Parachlamydiaceae bacterium]
MDALNNAIPQVVDSVLFNEIFTKKVNEIAIKVLQAAITILINTKKSPELINQQITEGLPKLEELDQRTLKVFTKASLAVVEYLKQMPQIMQTFTELSIDSGKFLMVTALPIIPEIINQLDQLNPLIIDQAT